MQNSFFLLLIFGCAILLVCPLAAFGSEEGASCAPIAQIVGPGTTSNLEAIYKGICYQTVKSAQCDASWSQFQQIVLSKDPSSFNWRDFESLFSVLATSAEPGKSTFWAGDGILVHQLSRMNSAFQTLEDTFPASSLNGFTFCPTAENAFLSSNGNLVLSASGPLPKRQMTEEVEIDSGLATRLSGSRSFNMQACTQYVSPGEPLVPAADPFYRPHYEFGDAFAAFWQAASIRFAQLASGEIHIVFEVSDEGPAFCSTDFFGSIELPSVNKSQVTGLEVLVATNSRNPSERCDSGSFANLRTLVATLLDTEFPFVCRNDPYALQMVRCSAQKEKNEDCQNWLQTHFGNEQPMAPPTVCKGPCGSKRTFTFLALGIGIGTFIIGFLLAAWIPMLNPFLRSINQKLASPSEPSANDSFPHPSINAESQSLLADPEYAEP